MVPVRIRAVAWRGASASGHLEETSGEWSDPRAARHERSECLEYDERRAVHEFFSRERTRASEPNGSPVVRVESGVVGLRRPKERVPSKRVTSYSTRDRSFDSPRGGVPTLSGRGSPVGGRGDRDVDPRPVGRESKFATHFCPAES